MKVFVNLSNHRSEVWSDAQRKAAEKYGSIVDLPFPIISSQSDSDKIDSLVSDYLYKLSEYDIGAVMLQGEFVFTYRLVTKLKDRGITVLSASSERIVTEETDVKGKTRRTSEFEFVQFREY